MKTLLASFLVLRSYTAFDLEHYLSRLSVRVDCCGLVEAPRTALGEKRYLYFAFLARRNGILRVFRTRAAALRTHILYHKITVACVDELTGPPFSSIRPKSWRSSVNLMRASPPLSFFAATGIAAKATAIATKANIFNVCFIESDYFGLS